MQNGMTAGGLAAILLTLFVEITEARRRWLEMEFDISALPRVREFLNDFASRSGWNESMSLRLESASEEIMLTLFQRDGSSAKAPYNATAIANRWLVTGNKKSKCFDVGSGHFRVDFNGSMMLHGVYGGEDGRPVNAGDFVVYGHFVLFDTCPQQLIVIQVQTDIPARILPVEGWIVEELRAYHRQLGRGRVQSTFKSRPSPDDPTMVVTENQSVVSFP